MVKTLAPPLSIWQIGLIILVANVIPLAFISIPPDFLFSGSIGVTSIDENIKFAAYLVGSTLIISLTLLYWSRQRHFLLPSKQVLIPAFVFFLSFVLSFWHATDLPRAWVIGIEVYLIPLFLFLLLSTQSVTDKRFYILVVGLCIAPVITSLIGIAQAMDWWPWIKMLPATGNGSLLYNQNLAGEFIILFIPLVAGLALAIQIRILQAALLCIFVLLCLYLVLTSARGAWVGLITAVAIGFLFALGSIFYCSKRRPIQNNNVLHLQLKLSVFIAIIPFFILLIYTSPGWTELGKPSAGVGTSEKSSRYIEEFKNIEISESTGRFEIWQDSLEMVRDRPWLGIGSDHFKLAFPKYIEVYKPFLRLPFGNPLAGYIHTPFRTHNDYLQVWIELGIFGLIALVSLFSVVSWQAWKGFVWMQQTDQSKRFFLLLGTFGGFVAWTVSMLFEFPFRMPSTLFIGWLFAAAIFILTYNKNDKKQISRLPLSTTLAFSLIVASFFIAVTGAYLGQSIFFGSLYNTQGELALKAGNINQAQSAFSESYKKKPWEENYLLQLIRIHLLQKNYSQAKLLSDQIIHRQPYLFIARLYRAQANYALGDKKTSREDIRFVVRHMSFLPEAEKYQRWLKYSSD